MKAFFRAVGPDFHSNLLSGPFESVNVYPLMCHLLGIQPDVNDGSLDNTRHMLISNGKPCDIKGRFDKRGELTYIYYLTGQKLRSGEKQIKLLGLGDQFKKTHFFLVERSMLTG